MPWEVINYHQVSKFIDRLPKSLKTRIISHIDLLEIYGPDLRIPVSKKIYKDLYELRIIGKNSIRILYTYQNNKFYLVNIFKKKSERIPKKEIKTALDRIKLLI